MGQKYDDTNRLLARAISSCAGGDDTALSDIYQLTAAKFAAVVEAQVDSSETTREILRRTYLSIWLNAAEYDPSRATPLSWLLLILRNCAADARQDDSLPPRRLHHEPRLEMAP